MEERLILGLMSGTSMDGLDIACVRFQRKDNSYNFDLIAAETFPYSLEIKEKLKNSGQLTAFQLRELDLGLGRIMGEYVNSFLSRKKLDKSEIEIISSHGHTIFHQPSKGVTFQIGSGHTLSAETGIKVVNDFRTKDVINGGQGAPLVPIGDHLLFKDKADAFINLGGFANISFRHENKITAFDICPCNLPMNKIMEHSGKEYDKNGEMASSGSIHFFLLDLLNGLEYYSRQGQKSLGTEWLDEHFYPLIKTDKDAATNLRTIVEHIAVQITEVLNQHAFEKVYFTGGGVKNQFLMSRIGHYFKGECIVPEENIIDFKEAVIFAFLGYRYLENEVNSLASVTGAKTDLVNGVLFLP